MEKTENQNNVTADPTILNYANPYFVPIEDGDEETIKHYKRNNVPVAHIALPRRMRHYYAIFDAATKEEADFMNKLFNNWSRKDERDRVALAEFETSYEVLVENGFEQKSTGDNPEEIVAYNTVIVALYVLQEGVDADGGYLVPVEYDNRLIQVLEEENIMRALATKITTSGEHKINIAATTPAALWVEEGGALTFGDATFDQKFVDSHKLHVAIKVTEELLYDSAFDLEKYILTQFGKALANAEEDAFLNGDGKGKPYGVFDTTTGGTKAGNLAADIKADDIFDLIYKLKRPYRKGASFIMNDKTIAQIRKLKDNNGQYLWQPSLVAGEPDQIAGYKVRTSAYAPENAISFGDYSYYNIADRGARSFKTLNELFAGNGMVGFVAKERVDGLLLLPEAVQILNLKTTASSKG